MRFKPQITVLTVALALAALSASVQLALGKRKEKLAHDAAQMDEQKRAVHALNRLGFGPRPGEVERVAAMGVDHWIDQQLHPERIDDSAIEARLEPLRTLRMDTREMVENFPPTPLIKAVADHKQPLPSDPSLRAVYEAQLERYYARQEQKQQAAGANVLPPDNSMKSGVQADDPAARQREDRLYADLKADQLIDLPADQRMKTILGLSPAGPACPGSGAQRQQARPGDGGHESQAAGNAARARQSATGRQR
jgi:hypothetical protein